MQKIWTIAASLLLLLSLSAAQAESKKEGEAAPYVRLETITVNLKDLTHYLQVDISLKVANPKLSEAIKNWTPPIRHELILLLSDESDGDLATLGGKQKIMAAIRTAINKILKLDDKEGVTDVLFESFVIQ